MDFLALAQECAPAVHPQTLAAIVKIESGFKPFAIGINKGTATLKRQPESKEEAVKTAKELIAGGHNIDMGLGQINSANLRRLGLTVKDVFDPGWLLNPAKVFPLADSAARREGAGGCLPPGPPEDIFEQKMRRRPWRSGQRFGGISRCLWHRRCWFTRPS